MVSNSCQCKCGVPITEGTLCETCKKASQAERSRLYHAARRKDRATKGLCIQCGGSKEMPQDLSKYIKENADPLMVKLVDTEQVKQSTFCYKCYVARKLVSFRKRQEKEANDPRPKLTPKQKEKLRKKQVRESGRKRRARILAENPSICAHCLKRPKAEGKRWCDTCLERANKINKSRIKERLENSACIMCGAEANGEQLCQGCKELQKKYSRRWWNKVRKEREKAGLCSRCGNNPHEPGKKSCSECLEKIQKYVQSRAQQRLCKQCNKNPLGYKERLCAYCKAQNTKAKNSAKSQTKTPVTMPEFIVQAMPTVSFVPNKTMHNSEDDTF